MHALVSWRSLFALVALLAMAEAVVHRIPTVGRKLSKEASETRLKRAHQSLSKMLPNFAPNNAKQQGQVYHPRSLKNLQKAGTGTLDLNDEGHYYYSVLVGNISVGTPPQILSVDVDLFYSSAFELVDSNATLGYWDRQKADSNNSYNSSASSTYSDLGTNFTTSWESGHNGQDILRIGSIEANVSIAVLDETNYDITTAGLLGLANLNSTVDNSTTNLISQLIDVLDQPIITLAPANTSNVKNHLTLGGLDTEHCEANYAFGPNAGNPSNYGLNVTLASAVNSSGSVVQSVGNVIFVIFEWWYNGLIVTPNVYDLILNATNAQWSRSYGQYVVDCNTTGNVVLSVGTGQVVLTAFDLILSYGDHCTLNAYKYDAYHYNDYAYDSSEEDSEENTVEFIVVGADFLENHCLAYNVRTNEVGIANVTVEPSIADSGENVTATPPVTQSGNSTSSVNSTSPGYSNGTSTVSPPVNSTSPSNSTSSFNATSSVVPTNSSDSTTLTPPVNSTSSSNSTSPVNGTSLGNSTNGTSATNPPPTQLPVGSTNGSNSTAGSTPTPPPTEEQTTILLDE